MYFLDILIQFIKTYPGLTAVNTMFMAMAPINEVLLPHLYGKLVESVRKGQNFSNIFFYIILTLIFVQVAAIVFDLHDTIFNPIFQSYVRNFMLETIFKKYDTAYDELSIGGIITSMIKAPAIILTWFSRVKDFILPYIFVFISAAIYFMYYDILLGVTLIILIAILGFFMVISPNACMAQTRKKARLYATLYEEVDDVLRNLLSVYTSNKTVFEVDRLKNLDTQHRKACMDTMRCALWYKVISFPLIVGFFALFLYRCYSLVQNGKMKVSAFVSLLMIFIGMMNNLMWIVDVIRDIIFDSGFLKEAEEKFEYIAKLEVTTDYSIPKNPPYPDGIGLYNVSFTYEKNKEPVIQDLSIHFAKGERVIISGAIGTGKSTISKLLEKLYLPSKGDLYLDGKWYSTLTPNEVRIHVGYVPQQAVLFNRSVYENIKYGNDPIKVTNEYIDKLVEDLEIIDEFSNLSEGLNTQIGKNGSKLSGGQRQLVWCIRTIIRNPEVIVLDEPTSSMDEKTKKLLNKILDVMMKGKTVIMITHDETLVKQATRVIKIGEDKDNSNNMNHKNGNGNGNEDSKYKMFSNSPYTAF